jgi:hypothetical protein
MIRILGAPHDVERGDIAQDKLRVPPLELVGAHLLYWAVHEASLDPRDCSMDADISRILVVRLSGLVELHAQYISAKLVNDPFTPGEQKEFQLRGNTAVAASMLAIQPPVKEYVRNSQKAEPTEIPPVCFDPGERDLRWHILPGAESDLIPGYVSSETPETWYESDQFFIHTKRAAVPTDAFRESFNDYYGTEFVPEEYRTITPLLNGNTMSSLE